MMIHAVRVLRTRSRATLNVLSRVGAGLAPAPAVRRRRKPAPRLPTYDYTLPGPYFVAFCTAARRPAFAVEAVRDEVVNQIREIAKHSGVALHESVVADDHVHLLVSLPSPILRVGAGLAPAPSLPSWIRQLKSRLYRFCRERFGWDARLWHRSYYDHVIRNDADFFEKAKYLENHPFKEPSTSWAEWHESDGRAISS